MKNRTLPIVLIAYAVLGCAFAQAQFSDLVNRPYHLKLDAIHQFYKQVIDLQQDSVQAYARIDRLRQAAQKAGDVESELEADLAEALFDFRGPGAPLAKMHRMAQRGKEREVWHIASRATYVIALHHWDNQQYELSFRWYAALDSLMQQVSIVEFPDKVTYLQHMGEKFMRFGDLARALDYFKSAVDVPEHDFYEHYWKHAMNNLGLVYQQRQRLDSADWCFSQVLTRNTQNVEIWEGIVSGNRGYNEYLRGDFERAIPLLQRDVEIAVKHGDYGLAAGSAIPLADILTRQGVLTPAKTHIDSAFAYIRRSDQFDRLRKLFPVMGKWYAASGDAISAARYMDSALTAGQRYQDKFSALLLLRAQQEQMASQREAEVQRLRAEGQRQVNRRNIVLGALAFSLLLGGFWAFKQRKANELALKDRDLRLLEADKELQDARSQLEDFARAVAEKNQLLEAQVQADKTAESGALIEQLAKQVVLTDADWERFSTLFGKVYPGFQHQLKSLYPSLTPAEIRCLSMEKLRFSNKEMAALQGISTSTVMSTKHRIRKKLSLTAHAEVIDFVQSI